jgi:hypothetical protein
MYDTPDASQILGAVNKVRAHKIFNRSPLMCAFLSYVTHETLQGREARISAYSVAVDALNKPADFDPQMDPSVRVLAKRLRDSLAKYYEEESDYDVQVILTPGSYVPSFSHVRQPNQKTATYRSSPTYNVLQSASGDGLRVPWTTPVLCFEADE